MNKQLQQNPTVNLKTARKQLRYAMEQHLKNFHQMIFYDYQWSFFDKIIDAILANIEIVSEMRAEDIEKLESIEIGAEFSRQCLATDEYVYTPTGVKLVADIQNGDEIIGGVVANRHEFEDELFEITFWNGIKIKANAEHPFMTKEGWKKTTELDTVDAVEFISSNETIDYSESARSLMDIGGQVDFSPTRAVFSSVRGDKGTAAKIQWLLWRRGVHSYIGQRKGKYCVVILKRSLKWTAQSQKSVTGMFFPIESIKHVGKGTVVGWTTIGNNEIISYGGMRTHNSGKTTTIVHTAEFILEYVNPIFELVFKRPIAIGIFGRQNETVKTDFDRLKAALQRSRLVAGPPQEANAHTLVLSNGASCYVFPISPTSHPESKSLDLIVIEEAQLAPDMPVGVKIAPMGKSTNAPMVYIGTSGYTKCRFYYLVANGKALVYDWERVAADRRKAYEKDGDIKHLLWEQSVKSDIVKKGRKSDEVRISYYLEWILEKGMFVTEAELIKCRVPGENNLDDPDNKKYDHYAGLDTAKHHDRTVLKIAREIDGKITVVYTLELEGMNYEEQFKTIVEILKYFKLVAIAIDSTGQGDFMPDLFENVAGRNYAIERVSFNLVTKDNMYKSWLNKILNSEFAYYYDPADPATERFEFETTNLVKEQKGTSQQFMSVHHGEEPNATDDHCDSCSLTIYAYDSYNKNSGIFGYFEQKAQDKQDAAHKQEESKEPVKQSQSYDLSAKAWSDYLKRKQEENT